MIQNELFQETDAARKGGCESVLHSLVHSLIHSFIQHLLTTYQYNECCVCPGLSTIGMPAHSLSPQLKEN